MVAKRIGNKGFGFPSDTTAMAVLSLGVVAAFAAALTAISIRTRYAHIAAV